MLVPSFRNGEFSLLGEVVAIGAALFQVKQHFSHRRCGRQRKARRYQRDAKS